MNANNVSAAKPSIGGAVYRANTANPTLPTDTSDTLTDFTSLGYISDDGIVNNDAPSVTLQKAFGGDVVLASQGEKQDTWKFKLLEVYNVDVLKAVYGDDNVTGELSTGITVKSNNRPREGRALVFNLIGTDGVLDRIVCPNARIQSLSEIKYHDTDARGFEITYVAIPDSDGNTHYHYMKKPV